MTESEWDACTDPRRMLRFLIGTDAPRVEDVEAFPDCKTSDRKLRLFACHCFARIRHLLSSPLAEGAVKMAAQFAEGAATAEELQRADAHLREALDALEGGWRASHGAERTALLPRHEALALAFQATRPAAPTAAYYASSNAYLAAAAITNPGAAPYDRNFHARQVAEERAQTDLLRELIGPTLFRPVAIDAAWPVGSVVKIAQAIYEEKRFDNMGILADALEEAGCDNAVFLSHCRGKGPHVRGCWALDVLLGKS
jgi:hypothetical protein